MGAKINPRRRPMSEADVRKAWSAGADFGMSLCIKAFLFILKDKHRIRNDEILKLKDEFEDIVDAINRRDITMDDIDAVLDTDFDLHVRLT